MTPQEKQLAFQKDLQELLLRYGAELNIEETGTPWAETPTMVVDFSYDESLYEENKTGIVPQLVLGTWFDGKE